MLKQPQFDFSKVSSVSSKSENSDRDYYLAEMEV